MSKTILLTGATDGIGLETAKKLIVAGHHLLLHGRNPDKLAAVQGELAALDPDARLETYVADLSNLAEVEALAEAIAQQHEHLDVVINNAGIFRTSETLTPAGLDVRFVVNTLAPYLLTQKLSPLLDQTSRVVNLSSAAQAPVDLQALAGRSRLEAMAAYSQSKLALTMWSFYLANQYQQRSPHGPMVVAVNPGSLLASKMVKEGFGVAGNDLSIGADILVRAALSAEFADANGKYFDNDAGRFNTPHTDALNATKCESLIQAIEALLP